MVLHRPVEPAGLTGMWPILPVRLGPLPILPIAHPVEAVATMYTRLEYVMGPAAGSIAIAGWGRGDGPGLNISKELYP